MDITCGTAVFCCAALPGYVAQPGGVDLGSIYAEGLQLGWNVNSTSNITLQEVPIGINGSLAMCANMPAFEVSRQQLVNLNVLQCILSQLERLSLWHLAHICRLTNRGRLYSTKLHERVRRHDVLMGFRDAM